MDWMKLLAAAAGIMMLFMMYPAYKHWSENSPEAGEGDWQAAILPLVAIAGLVVLLVMMVQ